jgi:hypothetical protein
MAAAFRFARSAASPCASEWTRMTLRYCEPSSFPWRSFVVGSWMVKKTSSSSGYVITLGSKVTCTTSAWPVASSQTCSYVGRGTKPPA